MIGHGYPATADQSVMKLPQDWEVIDDTAIMDADGWDRQNYAVSWLTPITYAEWKQRAARSTSVGGLRTWKPIIPEMGVCLNRQCKARHPKTANCEEPRRMLFAEISGRKPDVDAPCLDPLCKNRNWGGRNRDHSRFADCPPAE